MSCEPALAMFLISVAMIVLKRYWMSSLNMRKNHIYGSLGKNKDDFCESENEDDDNQPPSTLCDLKSAKRARISYYVVS